MSKSNDVRKIKARLMTLIVKLDELEQVCRNFEVDLYPEIHIDGIQQNMQSAYMKLETEIYNK